MLADPQDLPEQQLSEEKRKAGGGCLARPAVRDLEQGALRPFPGNKMVVTTGRKMGNFPVPPRSA